MSHDPFFKRVFPFDDVVRRRYRAFRTGERRGFAVLGDLLLLVVVLTLVIAGLLIVLIAFAAALVIAPVVLLTRALLRLISPPRTHRTTQGTVIEVDYERED